MNEACNTAMLLEKLRDLERENTALRRREEYYRDLIENAADGMYAVDLDGCFKRVNDAFLKESGYAPDEVIGHNFAEILHPEDLAPLRSELPEILNGEAVTAEVRCRHRDGSFSWFSLVNRAVREGADIYIYGVARNIDRRVRADEDLRRSEERYRTLLDNIPDVVYALDSQSRIASVNLPAIMRYGYRAEDVIGRRFDIFVYPDDRGLTEKIFRQSLEQRQTFIRGLKFRIRTRNGDIAWVEVNSHKHFNTNGLYVREEGVLRDISRNKLLEEQLVRSERMAATGQLAASIAHEINSPLQGIKSLLDMMKRQYDHLDGMDKQLDLMEKAFGSIGNITRKLLDLNRPGLGDRQIMDLNKVVVDVTALMRSHLRRNRVRLELQLEPQLPRIEASPQQISQVILNLVNNSMQALESDNVMADDSHRAGIDVRTYGDNGHVIIEVADNGPGIDPDELETVFDLFYTSNKSDGMGIGLSLCRSIIEQNGGWIKACNRRTGGAVFKFALPVARDGGMHEALQDFTG